MENERRDNALCCPKHGTTWICLDADNLVCLGDFCKCAEVLIDSKRKTDKDYQTRAQIVAEFNG
jgi:hypothetical protein